MAASYFPLRGLVKSRGDFTHVEIVSTTDIKKRPEIGISPQDENIFEIIFFIGPCEASVSCYKYTRGAMKTLHLAFVRRIAKWKSLFFHVQVAEEKKELSVETYFRTSGIFHYLWHLEVILGPGRGYSVAKSCLPEALQGGFYPLPVLKISALSW